MVMKKDRERRTKNRQQRAEQLTAGRKDKELTQRTPRPGSGQAPAGAQKSEFKAEGLKKETALFRRRPLRPQMKTPRAESGRTFLQLLMYHKNKFLSSKFLRKL